MVKISEESPFADDSGSRQHDEGASAAASSSAGPLPPASIAEIAVNAPLDRLFHYQIPEHLRNTLRRGSRVLIPFGRRTTTGVCVGFPTSTTVEKLRPLKEVIQPDCCFDAHLLELTRWISEYYFASWGEVLEAALPPGIRVRPKEKKPEVVLTATRNAGELNEAALRLEHRAPAQSRLLRALAEAPGPHRQATLIRALPTTSEAARRLEEKGFLARSKAVLPTAPEQSTTTPEEVRSSLLKSVLPEGAIDLHEDQLGALGVIEKAIDGELGSPPRPVLIHGITGSGKTEVYLRALHEVLKRGGRGLVLVPEISLTPQTVNTFREGLPGVPLAVQHSMLTTKQRAEQWRDLQAGRIGVVIGARSAVFSPLPDLGIIIVDEEHEPSYKQETSPRYHGRDVAIMRAHMLKIPIVLGSATPALESYQNARLGKYHLVEMPRRVTEHDLPTITVVPLGPEYYRPDGKGLICGQLDFQLKQCLRHREQAILFLNRRGFATFLHCIRCGFVLKCEACDITLTYHHRDREARCHYCSARYMSPRACPECGFPSLKRSGVGTEKVAEVLVNQYEGIRVSRMDRDTIKNHEALKRVLEAFARGESDVLVGTQMIAKGHDFPGVSIVGILSADTGLHFPDCRAAERTFQLITQVAGRAGRGSRAGRVILQTFFPDNYAIRHAVDYNYRAFFECETAHRQALGYPPFGRLARILIQDSREERAEKTAGEVVERLRGACQKVLQNDEGVEILGPAAAPITRIQERHRFQILLKARSARPLLGVLKSADLHPRGRMSAEVIVDMDPLSLL